MPLTPTKTLPKKYDYSPVIFQITLSTYKLDSLPWDIDIDIDKKKKCRSYYLLGGWGLTAHSCSY